MKKSLLITGFSTCGILVCLAIAGDNANKTATPIDQPTKQRDTAIEEIHQTAKAFAIDFNRGDAQAVASHWTEAGDYVNENGQRFQGREAIEKEYAAFFAATPDVTIHLSIDSVRLVDDGVAIEDGRATLGPLPQGPPAHSRYCAVHVKRNGQWLMSSVRDSRVELASNHRQLADLNFLVGTWHSEGNGSQVESNCRWISNKNFIERTHTIRDGGKVVATSTQIIGWDPLQQRIVSWTFTSEGGHAMGVWTSHESGWIIETTGVLMEGTQSAAVNILSYVSENALSWKSVNRTKGGRPLPEMQELVLKRQ